MFINGDISAPFLAKKSHPSEYSNWYKRFRFGIQKEKDHENSFCWDHDKCYRGMYPRGWKEFSVYFGGFLFCTIRFHLQG